MEVIAETSKWLPSLNLSASKNFGKDNIKLDTLLENVNVVFTLDIPIFKEELMFLVLVELKWMQNNPLTIITKQ